ncbi:ATP-dependent 6-phosphofructokinase [Robertkochia solimangrovi]|uniref:ATP-dependent 6-phosphofructokinase n=1 Tax=Robertkochia solimangrovi TaxID=2213046 RepID=UPI00117D2EA7|nr:ATP-dependent 6-phosphofructokinase [Robertkochia solimangrovi]TRZ40978.1 6-phosphofructokinase [Robertkochia solimangrovi]
MENLAIITSGGDAPGLNACIHAVVKSSVFYGLKVFGVRDGFNGLISGEIYPLRLKDVHGIIPMGGTILRTSRSEHFQTRQGRFEAYEQLKKLDIHQLIIIGGDGTMEGAKVLAEEYKSLKVIGIPKTIDNDLEGTEYSIGFDTALNTAVDAIDRIRDTAESHNRIFLVEVMGRDAGYIAYGSGLATGAEGILIPETSMDMECLQQSLSEHYNTDRALIIVVAEGDEGGGAMRLKEDLSQLLPDRNIRVTILGHIQRGGKPTAFDRILATRFGIFAVETLLKTQGNAMVGMYEGSPRLIPFSQIHKRNMKLDDNDVKAIEILTFQV